jgi:hypothetical protein
MENQATKFDYFIFCLLEESTCKQLLFIIAFSVLIPAIVLAYLGNLLIDWPGAILGYTFGFSIFPVYFVRAILKNMGLLDAIFKKKRKAPISWKKLVSFGYIHSDNINIEGDENDGTELRDEAETEDHPGKVGG